MRDFARHTIVVVWLACVALLAADRLGAGGLIGPAPGPRFGLMVYEVNESSPALASMQTSLRRSEYFHEHGHDLVFLDKDAQDKNDHEAALLAKFKPIWSTMKIPALIITTTDGTVISKSEQHVSDAKAMQANILEEFKKAGGG